jgi:hypothetical protein
MQPDICALAEALLRNAPSHTLPLWRLHRSLRLHLGTAVGDHAKLADVLAATGNFTLTQVGTPLEGVSVIWDEDMREQYRAALQDMTLANTRVELRTSLIDASHERGDGLDLMAASLLRLAAFGAEPTLADRIAEARAEYGALRSAIGADAQLGR